ncbi:MAG TPA: PIN domain nuclease, partial [Vicinamibacteria bacterium]|nr:PIN domain nuclease [Vicinamibacteria bacterium]
MWLILFRAFVVVLLAHAGYVYSPFPREPFLGLLLGLGTAVGLMALEHKMRNVSGPHLVGALVGGVTGLFAARLAWGALAGLDIVGGDFVHVLMVVLLAYVGIVIGLTKGEWFEPARIISAFRDSTRLHQYKVLDTSVIIDGRIADICETGFLEGTLVVPQFVLRELQQVADSSDSLKRNRGRRGLDILQKIQKMAHVQVQIVETDFPEV